MDWIRRIGLAGAIAVLGSLALGTVRASAASLVQISIEEGSGIVFITGDDGSNDVTIGLSQTVPNALLITDTSGILDPLPPGCVRHSSSTIRCPLFNGINAILVRLEGGQDRFEAASGLIPESINVVAEGGKGSDTLRGRDGPGRDFLFGEEGMDHIFGRGGDDRLEGGSQDDELDGGTGTDQLDGGPGEDDLNGGDGFFPDRLNGGPDNDILNGVKEDDKLFGGGGNDELLGGQGDDKGIGGPGKDLFIGGKGRDRGKAEKEKGVELPRTPRVAPRAAAAGNPEPFHIELLYEDGSSSLFGMTDGADDLDILLPDEFPADLEIESGLGDIRLGSKARCLSVSPSNVRCPLAGLNKVFVELADGDDDVRVEDAGYGARLFFSGGRGSDLFRGGPAPESFDGGLGDDFIDGGGGRDRLLGGRGDDRLFGRGGVDFFSGGPGNDFARGGKGDDRGAGGPGKDDFKD